MTWFSGGGRCAAGVCQAVAMGDGAADNEATFERIKDMSPFIFPLFDHLGGIRVTAEDALTLLPGTYVNDVIVNFYAHYLRGTVLHAEQMQGVLVLPSYVFKLILDKGPQGAISACRKLDIFCYHTWFFFMCHEDHWYAAVLSDMHNIHPLLQAAHGLGPKTSVRRPALTIVNSMQGFPRVAPPCTAATRLLQFVAYEYRRRHGLRLDDVRTLRSDIIDIIDVHDAKVAAQEGVDCALNMLANFHFFMTRTKKERRSLISTKDWTQDLYDVPSRLELAELCLALSSEAQAERLARGGGQSGGRDSTPDHEPDSQVVVTALSGPAVKREQRNLAPRPAPSTFAMSTRATRAASPAARPPPTRLTRASAGKTVAPPPSATQPPAAATPPPAAALSPASAKKPVAGGDERQVLSDSASSGSQYYTESDAGGDAAGGVAGGSAPAALVEPPAARAAGQAGDASQCGSLLPLAPPQSRSRADSLRAHVRDGSDAALLSGPVVGADNPDLQVAQQRARDAAKKQDGFSGADEREEAGQEPKVNEDVDEPLPPQLILTTSWVTSMRDWGVPLPSTTMRRVAALLSRCPDLEPACFLFADCPFIVDGSLHADFVSDMTRANGGVAVSGAMRRFVHTVCVCASNFSSS